MDRLGVRRGLTVLRLFIADCNAGHQRAPGGPQGYPQHAPRVIPSIAPHRHRPAHRAQGAPTSLACSA